VTKIDPADRAKLRAKIDEYAEEARVRRLADRPGPPGAGPQPQGKTLAERFADLEAAVGLLIDNDRRRNEAIDACRAWAMRADKELKALGRKPRPDNAHNGQKGSNGQVQQPQRPAPGGPRPGQAGHAGDDQGGDRPPR
jgi:hypothetical protein